MPVVYLISDTLNYSLLICDDAGYGYSNSMGWRPVRLNEVKISANEVFVVDNRLTADEVTRLKAIIQEHSDTIFLLKVVDPFNEQEGHPYYRFLLTMCGCLNTFLLSVYTPAELTVTLADKYKGRFIHLPYPYLAEKEIENTQKANKIIISGSLNEQVYPYRYAIWKKVTRSWLRLFFFDILRHPGYAEMSASKKHSHSVIGENFVKHLSQYKYMLLCPSRAGVEFLKYNECAYAGCMPVGEPPLSYPSEIRELFLPLNVADLTRDTLRIIKNGYDTTIITRLRQFLRETRNPDKLNNVLENFILENSLHTS